MKLKLNVYFFFSFFYEEKVSGVLIFNQKPGQEIQVKCALSPFFVWAWNKGKGFDGKEREVFGVTHFTLKFTHTLAGSIQIIMELNF